MMRRGSAFCRLCKEPLSPRRRVGVVLCSNGKKCHERQTAQLGKKLRRSRFGETALTLVRAAKPRPRARLKYRVLCPNGDTYAERDDADIPLSQEMAEFERVTAEVGCDCGGRGHKVEPIGKIAVKKPPPPGPKPVAETWTAWGGLEHWDLDA